MHSQKCGTNDEVHIEQRKRLDVAVTIAACLLLIENIQCSFYTIDFLGYILKKQYVLHKKRKKRLRFF